VVTVGTTASGTNSPYGHPEDYVREQSYIDRAAQCPLLARATPWSPFRPSELDRADAPRET